MLVLKFCIIGILLTVHYLWNASLYSYYLIFHCMLIACFKCYQDLTHSWNIEYLFHLIPCEESICARDILIVVKNTKFHLTEWIYWHIKSPPMSFMEGQGLNWISICCWILQKQKHLQMNIFHLMIIYPCTRLI